MITTGRLSIRQIRADDGKALRAIWEAVAKTPYARYDKPRDLSSEAVERKVTQWASFSDSMEHLFFAVCLKETVIGFIALHRREKGFELGYCFHPDYHGKGYAKESVGGLLNALKPLGFSPITAGTALENTPSVRLLLSLGFRQTGTEKVSFYRDEEGNAIFFDGGIFELSP